jgi:TolA-binding protein
MNEKDERVKELQSKIRKLASEIPFSNPFESVKLTNQIVEIRKQIEEIQSGIVEIEYIKIGE